LSRISRTVASSSLTAYPGNRRIDLLSLHEQGILGEEHRCPLHSDAREIRRENVFVDLSSPYLDQALRHRALRSLGAARCLYGSDGPYGYPAGDGGYDHGAILRQIERARLSSQDLDRVFGANFKALAAV